MWVCLHVRYRSGLKNNASAYFSTTTLDWLLSYLWLVLRWGVAGKRIGKFCVKVPGMETEESWGHACTQCPCVCRIKGSLFKIQHQFLGALFVLFPHPFLFSMHSTLLCIPSAVWEHFISCFLFFFSFIFLFSFVYSFFAFSLFFSPSSISFRFFSDFYMPFSPFLYSVDVFTFFNVNPNTLPLCQLSCFWIFIVISINLHLSSSLTRLFLIVLYTYSVCICIYLYYHCFICFPVAFTELCACRSLFVNVQGV